MALATPFMIYGATLPQFRAYYPIWEPARNNIQNLVLLEIGMLVLMFNTEFFFRGFLLFSLKDFFNSLKIEKAELIAIILHSIPYALVHIGKPGLEVPYSFFVGLVFGYIALETRSILSPLAAHWSSSFIFDLMVLRI
ncbi:MAG: type II CAAX prenyl endopeptidase Rce1 family protein [Candidatus Hydrothermarchaeales archaeon]